MKIRLPDNCLRNSYATYAQTFRSLGDVARAMGDREETIKRFYVQTLKPGTGRHWFDPLAQDGTKKARAERDFDSAQSRKLAEATEAILN